VRRTFPIQHSRMSKGRYIILLLKNDPFISLGELRSAAISSSYRMKLRLIRHPINVSEYRDFLEEYKNLGHMTNNLRTEIVKPDQHYYILHHAVLCNSSNQQPSAHESSSTHCAVNATSNEMLLNDHIYAQNF